MPITFCRLCGEQSLSPVATDAGGNTWFRCAGCQCDQSDAVYKSETYSRPTPDRLECTPTPLRFLAEMHAACPTGEAVELRTPEPGRGHEPGNLHLFSPPSLEKMVRELGFAVIDKKIRDDKQVWQLKKTDGL